jgi:hypothetical protein
MVGEIQEKEQQSRNNCNGHYNNRGLSCNPHIIANNKERSFRKLAFANHNSSQILSFCDTKTFAPVQLQVLHNFRTWHNRKTFPIITASIYCVWLTLHRKLFATNPSPQRLSESTQKSIGFWYKIYRKPLVAFWESQQVCVRSYIENR